MKKKNQIAEVAVAADASSVLRLMAATFSNANKAVLELVQNGRRAGASRIEIVSTENSLIVVDDGSGIDDFGNLLAIAKSGWNESIQKDESPYGAGFLSALFAAEHLTVSSRGKTMRGKTADIIERLACPIEPDPQAPKKGTVVTLQQPVSALKVADVQFFLQGFPIPVLINGNEIRRDHADEGNFEDTPIGKIRLALNSKSWVAYLQGMRIASFDAYGDRDETVVHLDPTRFKGRMPDRDQLIEHEQQVKAVRTEMRAWARRQLLQMRETMPADEFVQLTTLFNNWQAWDLLNDVDVLPHSVFSRYEDLPTYGRPWDSGIHKAPDVETARGKIPMCLNTERTDEQWLAKTYCCALGMPMIDVQGLDDSHWALQEVQFIDLEGTLEGDNVLHPTDKDIEIIGECLATGRMPGLTHANVKEVRVLKSITLKGPLGEVELPRNWGVYLPNWTLYITSDTTSDVLLQASDYLDDERFDEDAFDQDEKIFDQIQRVLASGDHASLLRSTLVNECPLVHLKGKQFLVTIDDNQEVTVDEMPKAA